MSTCPLYEVLIDKSTKKSYYANYQRYLKHSICLHTAVENLYTWLRPANVNQILYEVPLETKLFGYIRIRGRADLIVRTADRIYIVEVKSYNNLKPSDVLQLIIYMIIAALKYETDDIWGVAIGGYGTKLTINLRDLGMDFLINLILAIKDLYDMVCKGKIPRICGSWCLQCPMKTTCLRLV